MNHNLDAARLTTVSMLEIYDELENATATLGALRKAIRGTDMDSHDRDDLLQLAGDLEQRQNTLRDRLAGLIAPAGQKIRMTLYSPGGPPGGRVIRDDGQGGPQTLRDPGPGYTTGGRSIDIEAPQQGENPA